MGQKLTVNTFRCKSESCILSAGRRG